MSLQVHLVYPDDGAQIKMLQDSMTEIQRRNVAEEKHSFVERTSLINGEGNRLGRAFWQHVPGFHINDIHKQYKKGNLSASSTAFAAHFDSHFPVPSSHTVSKSSQANVIKIKKCCLDLVAYLYVVETLLDQCYSRKQMSQKIKRRCQFT